MVKPKVKVNADFVDELVSADKKAARSKKADPAAAAKAGDLLDDARFANLFSDPDFQIDRESESYQQFHPHAKDQAGGRKKATVESEDEDEIDDGEGDEYDDDDEEDDESEDEEGGEEDDELGQMRAAMAKQRKTGRAVGAKAPPLAKAAAASSKRTRTEAPSTARGGGGAGVEPRMLALQHDVLKGVASGGGANIHLRSREMSFEVGAPPPASESSAKKGKGSKGRGKGGGKGGGKGRLNESIKEGVDAPARGGGKGGGDERRGLTRGMLGPGKGGKGKGKGGGKGGGKGKGKGRR